MSVGDGMFAGERSLFLSIEQGHVDSTMRAKQGHLRRCGKRSIHSCCSEGAHG